MMHHVNCVCVCVFVRKQGVQVKPSVKDSQWYDVGIVKVTNMVVTQYYVPYDGNMADVRMQNFDTYLNTETPELLIYSLTLFTQTQSVTFKVTVNSVAGAQLSSHQQKMFVFLLSRIRVNSGTGQFQTDNDS